MSFEELKEKMLAGLNDGILKESIAGLIDCYEQSGLSVDEAMDKLGEALMQHRKNHG